MKGDRSDFRRAPGTALSDRLRQQQEQARRRSEMAAAQSAKTAARVAGSPDPANQNSDAKNADAWLSALSKVPLKIIGEERLPLSTVYEQIVRAAIGVMNSGEPTVLMTWPARDVCLSAVTSLLALAAVAVAPGTSIEKFGSPQPSFERPDGFRALIYPYARTSHELARDVQIDREYLHRTHLAHLTRHTVGHDVAPALKDYHQILSRVVTLSRKGRDGTSHPEFEHPTLDEILPHGSCDGKSHPKGALLWKTSSRTDLKQHNTVRRLADDGAAAEYFLFGAKKGEELLIRKIQGELDLVIFDLTRTGRNRLGEDWASRVSATLKVLRKTHPEAGILGVTDDPWTFDKARFEVFNTNEATRKRRTPPTRSTTVTSLSSSILVSKEQKPSWAGCGRVSAKGFNGPWKQVAEDLRAISGKLRRAGNASGVAEINTIVGKLRRNASLPGSIRAFSDYLYEEHGNAAAVDVISGYMISGQVLTLTQPSSAAYQIVGTELEETLGSAVTSMKAFEESTPMAHILEEIVAGVINASSKALFMFPKQTLAEFAATELAHRIPSLQRRFDNGMIVFSGPGGLSDIATRSSSERNKFKKIFLIAPARDGVLTFFSRPWLPDEAVVLADGDTLRFSARDALRLADQIHEQEISGRLRKYAAAAEAEVKGLGDFTIALTDTPPLPEELFFPSESVIDLAGAQADGELIELTMERGQKIIARPGTGLVLRDRSHLLETFRQVEARDVAEQDEICVISSGFIDRARLLLSVPANAASTIRTYHEMVIDKFSSLDEHSDSDRLRTLVSRIDDPQVDVNRVRYWTHIGDQLDIPMEKVVSHAPQNFQTFLKFTNALGIGENLARRFWQWGVVAQRNSKVKAGMAFHDAYRNILTDPHAASAFARDEKQRAAIKRLRLLADEHVSPVQSIRRI
ncbi:MAG: hypothetical protein J7562_08975 [Agrobacterium tumefaciens]|nr:hypothetical protein [Agrobacterium tumefaciens]